MPTTLFTLALSSLIFIGGATAFAQVSSDMDAGYGSGGSHVLDLVNADLARDVVIQPDGKAVCVGSADGDSSFLVVRLTGAGVPDADFDTDGVVVTPMTGDDVRANSALLQPDGKIIAAGHSGLYGETLLTVARYLANGALDQTFGSGGVTTTAVGSSHNWATGAGLRADGTIVVAGTSWLSSYDLVLARYLPNGALDPTFGSGGIVSTDLASDWDFAHGMALAPDDKIIVVGRTRVSGAYDMVTARYNSDGTLDSTFGAGGVVITAVTPLFDIAQTAVVQTDQKIVVVGSSDGANKVAVLRFTPAGAPDTTFSADGIVEVNLPTVDFSGSDVALLPDGGMVIAARSQQGDVMGLALICLRADGSLDTDFSGDGIATMDLGNSDDGLQAIALQRDGKLVAAGAVDGASNLDLIVLRLHGADAEVVFWDDFESGNTDYWSASQH